MRESGPPAQAGPGISGAMGGRGQAAPHTPREIRGKKGDRNQFNYVDRQHKQFLSCYNPDNIILP